MSSSKNKILRFFLFNEPEERNIFSLQETSFEKNENTQLKENVSNNCTTEDKSFSTADSIPSGKLNISRSVLRNLTYLKMKFNYPTNSDVIMREFQLRLGDNVINAFILFYDGMIDRKLINDNILHPLMLLSNLDIKYKSEDIAACVRNNLIPHNQLREISEFGQIIDEINTGACAIFIDGISTAFLADVKGFEHRTVDKPGNELVIRGPHEGFNEVLRVNTALIRKRMQDQDLIVENINIGERSKTQCSMMYVRDIANTSLVDEVRKRLKSIKIDYLNDSGELEQFIEDSTYLPAPQLSSTERPDRAALMLAEGRVVIAVNGSPYVLILPVTFYDLLHSPEDNYSRFPYANLMRLMRYLGIFSALLLPGLYVAITNYHHEMIPTSLLLAIGSTREKVPFPSILEIIMMEISFELIREASIRIPGPIGPTLGIIGALILGQAAVAANIVSPILIIIVAVTGIGSFAIPDFTLAFSFRVIRFLFIILAAMAGLLGVTTGIYIYGLLFSNAKSFGVPFLSPYGPKTSGGYKSEIYKAPIWDDEKRPDYLNTKDFIRQPKISRGWIKSKHKSRNNI